MPAPSGTPVERLIRTAERWAEVREQNAIWEAYHGHLGPAATERERKAELDYKRAATRALQEEKSTDA